MVPKKSLDHRKYPLVSVLMPAYNAEKYIALSIESILGQTFKDFELIIVDDCSKDDTWKIVQKYQKRERRIIAIRNSTNLKLSKTLNIAIRKSKGKYVARMDADDWSYPDRLRKQYDYMERPTRNFKKLPKKVRNDTYLKCSSA